MSHLVAIVLLVVACCAAVEDTLQLQMVHSNGKLSGAPLPFSDTFRPSSSEGLHLGLDRMLLSLPGVSGVRAGGIGSYMAFSLWGSSSSQVDVYVDGIPWNHAGDGLSRLGDLDPARIESITVHKGGTPSFLPGSPMGGVIHVSTHHSLRGAHAKASVSGGPWQAKSQAELDWGAPGFHVYGRVGWDGGDNDYTYLWDQRLEYQGPESKNREDLVERRLLHNDHALVSSQLGLTAYPASRQSVSLWVDVSTLEKAFPQIQSDEDLDFGAERQAESGQARLAWNIRHEDRSRTELAMEARGHREEYDDRQGVLGAGNDYDRDEYANGALRLYHEPGVVLGWNASLLLSLEAQAHRYQNLISSETAPPIYRYGLEYKPSAWRSFGAWGTWSLQAAARVEHEAYYRGVRWSAFGKPLNRQATEKWVDGSLSWKRLLSREFSVEAQAATGHRAPSFMERFGDRGVVKGNPALESEASQTLSAGFSYDDPEAHFSLQARLYHRITENAITINRNSQSVIVFENTDRSRALGQELGVEWTALNPYRLNLAATHLSNYAETTRPGDAFKTYAQIPFSPVWTLALSHGLKFRFLELKHLMHLRGLTFINASNSANFHDPYSNNQDSQYRHDLLLTTRMWRAQGNGGLELSFGVMNVLNAHLFDFYGSFLPGRHATAALSAKW